MTNSSHEIPARVIAVLTQSTIQLLLHPGAGLADGGIPTEIPLRLVPPTMRMPNTMLTVTMENGSVTKVRARDTGTAGHVGSEVESRSPPGELSR